MALLHVGREVITEAPPIEVEFPTILEPASIYALLLFDLLAVSRKHFAVVSFKVILERKALVEYPATALILAVPLVPGSRMVIFLVSLPVLLRSDVLCLSELGAVHAEVWQLCESIRLESRWVGYMFN